MTMTRIGFFMLSGLMSTAALAWQTTPTDTSFINEQGLKIPGKLFRPGGKGPFPAVVMLHGCSGIYSFSNPASGVQTLYREWGDRLVAAGYTALLVDSFTPRGTQNECDDSGIGVSEVTDRPGDAYAAQRWLTTQRFVKASRIALLGWSHGGSSAMSSMDQSMTQTGIKPFRAAIAFYPGCGLYNAFGGITASTWLPYSPFRIHHGDADPLYQSGRCQTRVSRAQSQGASTANGNAVDLLVYLNANHSFDMAKAGSTYSQADQDAKAVADANTMSYLGSWLR